MSRVDKNKTQGFTLVELLVVMLVLVALSSITLDFTKDFAFQGRYEVTKDRYDKIKRAIIGRPDVLINGQPDISGFVADMGRLPRNIQELLVQNYCSDDYRISDNTPDETGITDATGATPKAWCTSKTPNGVWEEQSDDSNCTGADTSLDFRADCEAAGEIWSGWKGPYLTTQKPDYEENAFSDGWGNEASTTVFTDHNYGWNIQYLNSLGTVTTTDTAYAQMIIQSKGKDQADGGTGAYNLDYPEGLSATNPSINHAGWTVDISKINIRLKTDNYCKFPSRKICLGAGGSWAACRFTETNCNAIGDASWQDTNPLSNNTADFGICQFTEQSCAQDDVESGAWKACHYTSTTDCPTGVGGVDLSDLFNHSFACINAGGTWTASECHFTSNDECNAAGGIPEFHTGTPNYYLCKTCDISTKTACEDLSTNGHWPVSQTECESKGGNWSSPNCIIPSSAPKCDKAGGNWDGVTNCVGYDLCQFNAVNCKNSAGKWSPSCSIYNTYNQSDLVSPIHESTCKLKAGDWDITDAMCSLDGNASSNFCGSNNGEFQTIKLCMQVTYKKGGSNAAAYSDSDTGTVGIQPYSIILNGEKNIISFTNFQDSGNTLITHIPFGLNAVGIYYDSDNDDNCLTGGELYPNTHTDVMPILFYSNLYTIDW